jgi:hypothetical protein
VFVVQNGGVYYSETMLLWAIGWQEHPYKLFRYIRDHGNRKGKPELARENAVEQPMPREWWPALWKEEMTGIRKVGKVIGGAPIDPHLQLKGQEAADGASTSAADAVGRAEGGALAPLPAFASFDSVGSNEVKCISAGHAQRLHLMKWLQKQPLIRELTRALGKYFVRESGLTDAQMRHVNPIKYLWESRIG